MTKDHRNVLLSMAIFGTIGLVRNYIPYPSAVIAVVRAMVGALFLLLVHGLRREKLNRPMLKKNALLLCLSGVMLGANWILLFEAYRFTAVSVATVCYYMAPIFVILTAPLFFRERLTVKKGLCALAAMAGLMLTSGILQEGISGLTGVFFGLGAAVLYAGVVIANKFIRDLSANERTLIQLGVAAVALLPYVLLTEDLSGLETGPVVIGLLVMAGIVHTGIAYSLYFGSIRNLSAQTAAIFGYLDPVIAVILSVAVLREPLSLTAAVGVVLVIGAALGSEITRKSLE